LQRVLTNFSSFYYSCPYGQYGRQYESGGGETVEYRQGRYSSKLLKGRHQSKHKQAGAGDGGCGCPNKA